MEGVCVFELAPLFGWLWHQKAHYVYIYIYTHIIFILCIIYIYIYVFGGGGVPLKRHTPLYSFLEFLDFVFFGKIILAANTKFRPIHSIGY